MTNAMWHTKTKKALYEVLKTHDDGLTEQDALARLKRFGKNEFPRRRATATIVVFFRQFVNPLIAVLLVAVGVTLIFHEWTDAIVISIAVLLNVVIGFVQEYRAEHALLALVRIIAEEATVLRGGLQKRIPREDVVPGDILLLRGGDKVPADCRILTAFDFEVDEAILTGEAVPQAKRPIALKNEHRLGERTNMVYAGTVITRGQGRAVVVATGTKTEVGSIADTLTGERSQPTPLQSKLSTFSRAIAIIFITLSFVVFIIGVLSNRPPVEMFTIAVALAVAAIPEGLVVGATAILAIGMHRLIKQQALVRNLLAAETLGSTTVICTDKTGTITEGKMRVSSLATIDGAVGHGSEEESLLYRIGLHANESVIERRDENVMVYGTPTERGITLGAIEAGFDPNVLKKEEVHCDTIPFSSERKWSAALVKESHGNMLAVLGAPDALLARSTHVQKGGKSIKMFKTHREALLRRIRNAGSHGERVVGAAYASAGSTSKIDAESPMLEALIFVGVFILEDPVREGVSAMIRRAAQAGVRTILITGDHRSTATAVGKAIGLPAKRENILEGKIVTSLSDEALAKRLGHVSIFARMVPSEKVRIVAALQARGSVVAMTGDGVNDAPALHNADIGIGVGTATDVAKEAADMVILDNNFATIVRAIEEGRVIMDNIRKVTLYLLSDSFSEIVLIVGALLLGAPLPLLAKQILWINLVTDGLPNLALTVEPGEQEVMDEMPISREEPLLDLERKLLIATISIVTGSANLALFFMMYRLTGDLTHAQSIVFASLGITTLLYVFSVRSMRRPIWRINIFSNRYLLVATAAGAILQVAAISVPSLQRLLGTQTLTVYEWGLIVGMAIAVIVIIEFVKAILWSTRARTSRLQKQLAISV